MKQVIILTLMMSVFMACTQNNKVEEGSATNPLLEQFDTPYGVPPFHLIKNEHYVPAVDEAIKQCEAEYAVVANNQDVPTFENTIAAFENSGELLDKVTSIFYNLNSANTNDEMQAMAKEISPKLTALEDNLYLNPELFARVKSIHDNMDKADLTDEQKKLVQDYYRDFVKGGALLDSEDKLNLRTINEKLSVLTLRFGENVLAETNGFQMYIDNKEDLAGLPESVIAAAAIAAKEEGKEGQWLFTIHKPSMTPFLQYAENRELREKIFKAYVNKGDNSNDHDNKDIIKEIVSLRIQKAKLLGFNNFSEYALQSDMAKNPDNVYKLLDQVWSKALPAATKEASELEKLAHEMGDDIDLEAWDWWYYTEKLRKQKYDLDEEAIRPYFSLEKVRDGIFSLVNELYGITFTQNKELPVYHEDVTAWEVREANGDFLGIMYMDFYPRASKRGGAWSTSYRVQHKKDGEHIYPINSIVCNFTKPTEDAPSLLSFEEVETFYHEFGHGLHTLFSNVNYKSMAGTAVARDFVELPSQIMENWAGEPEMLKKYAYHYKTGELIPDELVNKMQESGKFNMGFVKTEYMSAAYLDLAYHTLTENTLTDINDFENAAMDKIGLIPEIVVRYRSTYFNHIFQGGYSSRYYSYMWSEVLDADAFAAFKETTLFDKETAKSFRENILSKGGTKDPAELYRSFRGRDPETDALMKRMGFL